MKDNLVHKAPYCYNAHITRGDLTPGSKNYSGRDKLRIFFGDPKSSKPHLLKPLRIDHKFWNKLDLRDTNRLSFLSCYNRKRRASPIYTVEQFNASYLRTPKRLDPLQTTKLLGLLTAN